MSLASAMSTALTGLTAAETQIGVVGNNLANSNTVGFKASEALFATQFLQTLSVGSAPTANSGGNNPVQEGLGVQVAEITPNFTQGTVSSASSPTDLAIQGDGFFIVQANDGSQQYTRNGTFTTNAENQLVTGTGNRVLGYGINNKFQINTAQLQPLQIPLGSAMVAKATTTATMQGALTPQGNIANTAGIIQSAVLTDGTKTFPQTSPTASLATDPVTGNVLSGNLSGTYKYYVVFTNGNETSRPQALVTTSPLLADNQVALTNLPTDASGQWTGEAIYRSVNIPGDSNFYQIATIPTANPAANYPLPADNATDSSITGNPVLNFNGPPATNTTPLTKVVVYNPSTQTYSNAFPTTGTLQFTGTKGGINLTTQSMTVDNTTTLKDLCNFLQGSLGIQTVQGGLPNSTIDSGGTGQAAGVSVTSDGKINVVSDDGVPNSVSISLSALQLVTAGNSTSTTAVNIPFTSTQAAKGQGVTADMTAYDSLGTPLPVTITAVLEATSKSYTEYRWYADCGKNDLGPGQTNISVGTGTVYFDGQGNLIPTPTSNTTVTIYRTTEPSINPLQFNLDFTQVSGLATASPTLSVASQDGSAPGVLSSFNISDNGLINGVFSNGISRDLGQILLARFSNPIGLEQQGQNMYAAGVNSGLPIVATPGAEGTGNIAAGSLELSNTDIGSSLIKLITTQTMYSSNTRVITTAQNMFNELLQLLR